MKLRYTEDQPEELEILSNQKSWTETKRKVRELVPKVWSRKAGQM